MRDLARLSRISLALSLLAIVSGTAHGQDLIQALEALPHVTEVKSSQRGQFEITFEQPVDHQNPGGAKFGQHLYLAATSPNLPVILGTEGYQARGPSGGELRHMLGNPNVLTVEHRYFGKSIPNPCVWEQLTIKNAADDMHEIVKSFKTLYTGKWVATGVSKGGQTSLYFKSYYPNDVDVTVAYVAPINVGQEDPRINRWFETVSDEATRAKILQLQIAFLKREDEIIPLLGAKAADYSMGLAKAYEYGVLEFPFAFWQYGSNARADSVPAPDAPAATLADAYKKVNAIFYYSDQGIKGFEAFYYQAFREIGYYNYDISDLKPYLKNNPNPTNMDLCPPGTKDKIVYNPETLAFVFHFLQYKAQNVVFVYGETDAWSSTAMQLIGRTNALKLVVKGAWHNASVRLASAEQKAQFFDTMDKWLGMKLVRE